MTKKKALIIGSGPIIIGQACEFDYSGTQACKALRQLGYEIVLVNSNPATIMTDPEMADATYIEPLNVARLTQIIEKERPDVLLPNLGGQSGLNLCSELAQAGVLEKYNVEVIGVQVDAIERGEDRIAFKNTMDSLGIEMARSEVAYSVEQALEIAAATVEGSAKMVLKSGEHPWELVDQVCSPGGTTIEGVLTLQEKGFEHALKMAFDAVLDKDNMIAGKK